MVKTALMREELEIPKGVDIKVDDNNRVIIKGSKGGPLLKDFGHASGIKISIEGKKIIFSAYFPRNKTQALIGTITSIVKNLILGVQINYKYISKICYSHFPCNIEVKEKDKEIHIVNFLGERAPRRTKYPEHVKITVKNDDVIFEGPDKELLGQTAANVKRCCRIKKKDPRVFQDGVYLYKKMLGDEILWEIK